MPNRIEAKKINHLGETIIKLNKSEMGDARHFVEINVIINDMIELTALNCLKSMGVKFIVDSKTFKINYMKENEIISKIWNILENYNSFHDIKKQIEKMNLVAVK